ncbi:MAG: NHLP leader peptide family RiPP precursor, partial [Acidobacteriota bacterium]
KNPKAVLEGQMGGKLPAGVSVKAVEETPNTIYVVVPYVAKAGDELSDGDLEAVAGGKALGAIGNAVGGAIGGIGGIGGLLGGSHGSSGGGGGSHSGGDTYECNTSQGGQNTRVEFNSAVTLK